MVKSGNNNKFTENGKHVARGTGPVRRRRSCDNRFLRFDGIVIPRLARGMYVRQIGKEIKKKNSNCWL